MQLKSLQSVNSGFYHVAKTHPDGNNGGVPFQLIHTMTVQDHHFFFTNISP